MELLFIVLGLLGTSAAMSLFDGGSSDSNDDSPPSKQSGSSDDGTGSVADADQNIVLSGTSKGYGGGGEDSLTASDSAQAYGGRGADTLAGTGSSILYGGRGADILTAAGSVVAYGGDGADVLQTGSAAQGYGGAGNDRLNSRGAGWGDDGDDLFDIDLAYGTTVAIYGGAGSDTMVGYEDNFSLTGPNDVMSTLYGGTGDDSISASTVVIFGEDGNDTLSALPADSALIYGGIGNDDISAAYGEHYGGDGDDSILSSYGLGAGDAGNDTISSLTSYGGVGNDVLQLTPYSGEGSLSASAAYGGDDDDTLTGATSFSYESSGALVLSGGSGADAIHSKGGEQVDAGTGNDTVFANSADLANTTSVILGEGADDLVMSLAPAQSTNAFGGTVRITDFNPATDQIALIVAPSAAASVQYTITPNAPGNYTEVIFTQTGTTETLTYRFDNVTTISAANISLYADQAAVLAGVSYQNLA